MKQGEVSIFTVPGAYVCPVKLEIIDIIFNKHYTVYGYSRVLS